MADKTKPSAFSLYDGAGSSSQKRMIKVSIFLVVTITFVFVCVIRQFAKTIFNYSISCMIIMNKHLQAYLKNHMLTWHFLKLGGLTYLAML